MTSLYPASGLGMTDHVAHGETPQLPGVKPATAPSKDPWHWTPSTSTNPTPGPRRVAGGIPMSDLEARGRKFGLYRADFRPPPMPTKVLVGLEVDVCARLGFPLIAKICGPGNSHLLHIMRVAPGCTLSLRGRGSADRASQAEPLHLYLYAAEHAAMDTGAQWTDSLTSTVRSQFDEHMAQRLVNRTVASRGVGTGPGAASNAPRTPTVTTAATASASASMKTATATAAGSKSHTNSSSSSTTTTTSATSGGVNDDDDDYALFEASMQSDLKGVASTLPSTLASSSTPLNSRWRKSPESQYDPDADADFSDGEEPASTTH